MRCCLLFCENPERNALVFATLMRNPQDLTKITRYIIYLQTHCNLATRDFVPFRWVFTIPLLLCTSHATRTSRTSPPLNSDPHISISVFCFWQSLFQNQRSFSYGIVRVKTDINVGVESKIRTRWMIWMPWVAYVKPCTWSVGILLLYSQITTKRRVFNNNIIHNYFEESIQIFPKLPKVLQPISKLLIDTSIVEWSTNQHYQPTIIIEKSTMKQSYYCALCNTYLLSNTEN